jgi:hypothetical protein
MLDNDIAGHGDLFDGTLHTAPAGMNIDSSSLSLCKKPELRAMRPTVKCGVFVSSED